MRCELDTRSYPKGIKVTEEEMSNLNITGDTFHPEWNYTIAPDRHSEAIVVGRRLKRWVEDGGALDLGPGHATHND